jgi:chromosomal replication initiation ATPase DnaA
VRASLAAGSGADRTAWEQVRRLLLQTVGESTFEIWLEPLALIAVDGSGTLIVSAPDATVSWIRERFGRLLNRAAQGVGRPLRIADEVERKAAETLVQVTAPLGGAPVVSSAHVGSGGHVSSDARPPCGGDPSGGALAGTSPGAETHTRVCRSTYPSSCTDVHNQAKEASR